MPAAFRFASAHLVALQCIAISAMLVALAFAPPVQGRMILVPLAPGSAQGMIARATQSGALLVGQGPLPGSFVVDGKSGALFASMLARGVLVITAPPASCGSGVTA